MCQGRHQCDDVKPRARELEVDTGLAVRQTTMATMAFDIRARVSERVARALQNQNDIPIETTGHVVSTRHELSDQAERQSEEHD